MLVNGENLRNITRSVRVLSLATLAEQKTIWQQIAMRVESQSGQNDYGWLQNIPRMREWIGDRVINNLSTQNYFIVNKEFEDTVGIKRKDVEDDNIGIYNVMFSELARNVAYSRDELVFSLLVEGFGSGKAYDGQAFFASNHKVGKKTFSNVGTKKLTTASYTEAVAQMQGITDDAGKSLRVFFSEGETARTLVVGPSNLATAKAIIKAERLDNGSSNVEANTAGILVIPELSGAHKDKWFLTDNTRAIKGLILQVRLEPEFTALDNLTDENVFMRSEFLYGWRDRKAAGYGFPQLMYGSDGTTAG